jgi:hypothetical protein
MASKKGSARPAKTYWQKRFRSRDFRIKLTASLRGEIELLGKETIKNVVDARKVRKAIEEWDSGIFDRRALADLIIHVGRRSETRARKQRKSLFEALDPELVSGINSVLEADVALSENVEDLIAQTLRQEFVYNLFVEIIHTSIVSFNKRVNPLFGGLTSSMLEGQIKSFIRMFMPMIQEQAVAFAISKANQQIFLGFARSIVRLLLDVPVASFASMVSAQQRKQVENLIKQAVGDPKLDSIGRQVALSVWDDVYAKISKRRVGDLIDAAKAGAKLAGPLAEIITAGLARPAIVELVAEEAALVGNSKEQIPNSKRDPNGKPRKR